MTQLLSQLVLFAVLSSHTLSTSSALLLNYLTMSKQPSAELTGSLVKDGNSGNGSSSCSGTYSSNSGGNDGGNDNMNNDNGGNSIGEWRWAQTQTTIN